MINYYLNFPIEIGQDYRFKTIHNFKQLIDNFSYFKRDFEYHKKEEQHAHNAVQIDYDRNNVKTEIDRMKSAYDNIIIANNGNGIAEVSDARVTFKGVQKPLLAERLRDDYLDHVQSNEKVANDLEESKIIKSALDFDGVYVNEEKGSFKGLQAWLDWNKERGGGPLILPPGIYNVEKRLIIPPNTTIYGHGATLKRFNNAGGWFTNLVEGESPIKYEGNGNLKFYGITFDGNHEINKSMNGIVLGHAENVTFRDCTILDVHTTHALDLNGCKDVLIDHCSFKGQKDPESNNKEAIQVSLAAEIGIGDIKGSSYDSTPSKNVVVQNCYFGPSRNYPSYATAVGDHFSVYDEWVSNVVIKNNFIEGTTNFALRVYKFKNTLIEGNVIDKCNGGIFATPTPGGYTSSHNAQGVQMGSAQQGENLRVIGNTITNIEKIGVHVSAYPNKKVPNKNESFDIVEIKDNTFKNIKSVGVYIPEAKRVKVIGNNVVQSSIGIQCYGTWHLMVMNNMVSNTDTIGIFVANNKNLETGSTQSHAIIASNQVYATGQDGIRVSLGSKFIKVDNNSVYSYGLNSSETWFIGGIYLIESHNSTVTNNFIRNASEKYLDAVRISEDCTDVRVWNIDTGGAPITILNPDSNFYGIRDVNGKKVKFEGVTN